MTTQPQPQADALDVDALLQQAVKKLTLIERRRIEAGVIVPLIRAFQQEIGEERANAIARKVIVEVAEEQGRQSAAAKGRNDLLAFSENMQAFSGGGALEIELVERNEERLGFNVRRCRFAEMYRALGAGDLGGILSCNRDFSNVGGFNPAIGLTRTQTIMQGAEFCDFRYRTAGAAPEGQQAST
ncbi:MAG TPA: L-2-amino-thiazoline-4-carboxylic acid hydrolase [Dehalococcoidia bacterium]|nr:L-2-amino-thiazoline-4-carboxylic acid hydrolase [Dehalococcoidia bacterium]